MSNLSPDDASAAAADSPDVNVRAQTIETRLDGPLLAAAILTIPAIVIEGTSLSHSWKTVGTTLNWVVWLAFLIEFVLVVRAADDRRAWIRSHPLDLAIIVLTPPFLPASLQAARLFRLLRLLRLVRLAMLTRRLLSTEGVRDAAVLTLLTVLAGGAAYSAVEKTDQQGHLLTTWDGVWWAMTTVTTVGYGDNVPVTVVGRIIAIVVMLVGIGFVAILTAAAADRFLRAQRAERDELRRVETQLEEILSRLAMIEERFRP